MEKENTIIEKLNSWVRNSITLKLLTITILMLLLLIPSAMIQSIIGERQALNEQTTLEVSASWANSQQFNGPVLSIPVVFSYPDTDKETAVTRYWHILPEELNVTGKLMPETLHRGIYKVVVFTSDIRMTGKFSIKELLQANNLVRIELDKAFVSMGVSDLRGIREDVILEWQGNKLPAEPGTRIPTIIPSGITFDVPDLEGAVGSEITFKTNFSIQGSELLSFVPVGKTTNVSLSSDWPSPSFNGNFLPDSRKVNENGFTADWKVLQLNRNFPQEWIGDSYAGALNDAAFGVNLLLPLDDYQKSMRSAKYAAMTIALTFLVFFLVEIMNRKKIHPFQYILVGLALVLFYTLLVSLAEHLHFNLAYILSAIIIEAMVTLYAMTIFRSKKLALVLFLILTMLYGFLFVILQLADYALLMGSIGLTMILGLTMYFTRNIDWYNISKPAS